MWEGTESVPFPGLSDLQSGINPWDKSEAFIKTSKKGMDSLWMLRQDLHYCVHESKMVSDSLVLVARRSSIACNILTQCPDSVLIRALPSK